MEKKIDRRFGLKKPNYRKNIKYTPEYDYALRQIGTTIRERRLELDLSMEETANRAGINKAILSRLENFISCPLMTTLYRICNVLNMTIKLDDKEVS